MVPVYLKTWKGKNGKGGWIKAKLRFFIWMKKIKSIMSECWTFYPYSGSYIKKEEETLVNFIFLYTKRRKTIIPQHAVLFCPATSLNTEWYEDSMYFAVDASCWVGVADAARSGGHIRVQLGTVFTGSNEVKSHFYRPALSSLAHGWGVEECTQTISLPLICYPIWPCHVGIFSLSRPCLLVEWPSGGYKFLLLKCIQW